jgi:hypothetical protein
MQLRAARGGDGNKACAPMHAPPALLSLMERVTMGDHESRL